MKKENNSIKYFSMSDKDLIRIEEQRYEVGLKKRLLEYGIVVDFATISHHGLRSFGGV
jgi:hypothetical protein